MNSEKTHFVAPVLSSAEAAQRLSRKRWFSRSAVRPAKVELVYLPYFLFQFQLRPPSGSKECLAVDAISGEVVYHAPLSFEHAPLAPSLLLPFLVEADTCQNLAIAWLRRSLMVAGLKESRTWSIQEVQCCDRMYYPYWVGYFKTRKSVRLDFIDAVSGRPQGPGVRRTILQGLAALSACQHSAF